MSAEPGRTETVADPAGALQFRSASDQAAWERDGYLIGPAIDRQDLDGLRRLWSEVGPDAVEGIWSNVHVLDPVANRRIDEAITRAFQPVIEELMANGHLAGSTFLVKGVGPGSASEPHQDWNNVDERHGISASLWCPLIDVDERNGALQVLPGSHRLRHTVRSLDTPSLRMTFDEVGPLAHRIDVPAGRCVLYAHNLFHGSRPNLEDQVRVAVTSGVLPVGTRHLHYRRAEDGTFEELTVEREFFFSGIPELAAGRLPSSARPAGTVEVPGGPLTASEVLGRGADRSAPEVVSNDGDGVLRRTLRQRWLAWRGRLST